MRPVKFKGYNGVCAKDQPEYQQLPVFVSPNRLDRGPVVFCMKLSFWERVRVLFLGCVWVQLLMFRDRLGNVRPITPSFFSTKKSEVLT